MSRILSTQRLRIEVDITTSATVTGLSHAGPEAELKIFFTDYDKSSVDDTIVFVGEYPLPVWLLKECPLTFSHVTKARLKSSYYEEHFTTYDNQFPNNSTLSDIFREALEAVKHDKLIMDMLS